MKQVIRGLLALCLLGSAGQVLAEALTYTRIYTDADGESHFEDVELDLGEVALPSGESAAMRTYPVMDSAMILTLEPGAFEDWHPSPEPRLCIVLQGQSEAGVTDGEVRTFGPGDMFIMEDTGKGHTTRTIGDVPHTILMIQLQDGYDG